MSTKKKLIIIITSLSVVVLAAVVFVAAALVAVALEVVVFFVSVDFASAFGAVFVAVSFPNSSVKAESAFDNALKKWKSMGYEINVLMELSWHL